MINIRQHRPTPLDICRRFDDLPNSAVVCAAVVRALTGLSERTIRYHPLLPRVYISADRYGFRVGDIRKLLNNGVPVGDRRIRRGPPMSGAAS